MFFSVQMYKVVNFENDNSVAIIPDEWLLGRTVCYWPNVQMHKVPRMAEQKMSPPKDWATFTEKY